MESGPPIQKMIIYDHIDTSIDGVEPCKQNVVDYSRIFWRIHFVCSCILYSVVVFQIAQRFRLTKCIIGRAAACIR